MTTGDIGRLFRSRLFFSYIYVFFFPEWLWKVQKAHLLAHLHSWRAGSDTRAWNWFLRRPGGEGVRPPRTTHRLALCQWAILHKIKSKSWLDNRIHVWCNAHLISLCTLNFMYVLEVLFDYSSITVYPEKHRSREGGHTQGWVGRKRVSVFSSHKCTSP